MLASSVLFTFAFAFFTKVLDSEVEEAFIQLLRKIILKSSDVFLDSGQKNASNICGSGLKEVNVFPSRCH